MADTKPGGTPGYWRNEGGNMVFVPYGVNIGTGTTSAVTGGPPRDDANGANLLHAMNAVAQAEERRPSVGGAKLLGLFDRRITSLENRVGRVEATK